MNRSKYNQGYLAFPTYELADNESDSFRMGWYDASDKELHGVDMPRFRAAQCISTGERFYAQAEESTDESAQALYYRLAAWNFRAAVETMLDLGDLPRDFFFKTLDSDETIS